MFFTKKSKNYNPASKDYFILGYRVAKKLERLWDNSDRYACIAISDEMFFFDTTKTTTIEAVQQMKTQSRLPYSVIGAWIDRIPTNAPSFSIH